MERAEPIVSRIQSAAKMKEGAQYKHHVAMSPPEDFFVDADDPWQEAMDAIADFCRRIEFDGVILAHPYSGDHDEEREKGLGSTHKDDRGEWKNRVFNERSWEDVREELKFRPHFHLIGCCSWFPGGDVTAYISEKTGWVTHRITERNGSPVSLGDMTALASATTYALSHVGIDTEGERNTYLRKKVGSAYHAADDRHHDEAREAIRRVAPKTLGIPSMEIECRSDLPEDEADHDDHEPATTSDDGAGDESTSTSAESTGMVPCRGDLVDVDEAEFVEDPEWRQTALHAEKAVETREEWKEAGGWQGWVGQATIDDDPPPD